MDYTYYLRTDASALDVERQITRATSGAPWRREHGQPLEPISVVAAVPGARRLVARSYGFEPDVVISVQLDKFVEDRRERETQALDVLRVLLEEYSGDLYVDYYDGNPVLVRRNGVLNVQRDWLEHRSWTAEFLPADAVETELAAH